MMHINTDTLLKEKQDIPTNMNMKQQASLLIALLINAMAHGYFAIVFPIVGRDYTLAQWHISLILSLSAVSMILFTPWWGKLCDKFGRRKVFLIGIASSVLSCFALVYCFSINNLIGTSLFWLFSVFLGVRIFHSIFTAGIHPAAQAMLAETSVEDKRARAMAFMGAAFGLGTILGGALAIFTGSEKVTLGFVIILTCLVLVFILCYKYLPETYNKPAQASKFTIDIKTLVPMLLTTLLVIAIYSALQPLTAWRMQDDFALNSEAAIKFTGAIMMSSMVAMILIQSCVVPLLTWHHQRLRHTGYVISIIAMLAAATVNAPILLLISMAIFGIGVGLLIPGNLAALSIKSADQHQARIAGVNGTFKGIGMALGPILGNLFYAINGTAFYWLAALMLIALLTLSYSVANTEEQ